MKRIIDLMHSAKAVAEWEAALAILALHGDAAEFFIANHIGHGIDKNMADQLVSLVQTLRTESEVRVTPDGDPYLVLLPRS